MKISNLLSVMTFTTGANGLNYRRSSEPDIHAIALRRSSRDLTGWNRGINGAVTVGRAFDDRGTRTPTAQSYLEFLIASGKYGTAEEILAAIKGVQNRASRKRRHAPVRITYSE